VSLGIRASVEPRNEVRGYTVFCKD
jgi:hypothetical protein